MLSKFQPCLPNDAEDRLIAERLLDVPATLRFLSNVKVNGIRVVTRPTDVRVADVDVSSGSVPLELIGRVAPTKAATVHNKIQWVDTPAALRTVSTDLRGCKILAFDVETALDFAGLCLLQVATRERTYLIDPFAVADLNSLVDILNGNGSLKVIHNARFERRVLAAVGIPLDNVFDTMEASRMLRGTDAIGGHSLAMVVERELDLALDKSCQTSNWTRRPLDPDQLHYAALDAEILLSLYDHFAPLLSINPKSSIVQQLFDK